MKKADTAFETPSLSWCIPSMSQFVPGGESVKVQKRRTIIFQNKFRKRGRKVEKNIWEHFVLKVEKKGSESRGYLTDFYTD